MFILAVLSVTFAFAAEECTHENHYYDWIDDKEVRICVDCGNVECTHSNRGELINKEGKYFACNEG